MSLSLTEKKCSNVQFKLIFLFQINISILSTLLKQNEEWMEAARQFPYHDYVWCHKGMGTLDGNNYCTCIFKYKFTFTPATLLSIVNLLIIHLFRKYHIASQKIQRKIPPSQPALLKNTSCGLGGLLGFFKPRQISSKGYPSIQVSTIFYSSLYLSMNQVGIFLIKFKSYCSRKGIKVRNRKHH